VGKKHSDRLFPRKEEEAKEECRQNRRVLGMMVAVL